MDSIIFELKKNVAVIRFNRPEKFNAFNREMALLFQKYLDDCASNTEIRCVLVTANGKAFSAGQDISELTGDNQISFDKILSEHFNPIIKRIRSLEKPVVCAVNGVAAGAGANIALCCDIVVASRSASFIQAFSKLGLIPDSGGTYFLPRLIGFQKASALMMLGDKVMAPEAAEMGMIYKFYEEEIFHAEAMAIAEKLSQMPTRGFALTKQALNQSMQNSLSQQLDLEDTLQFEAGSTHDYAEGIHAFIEKRQPAFQGK